MLTGLVYAAFLFGGAGIFAMTCCRRRRIVSGGLIGR